MSSRALADLAALRAFAAEFGRGLAPGTILRLIGPMGAGKTTFARFLLESLGVADVASPTYALHHRYQGGAGLAFVDHWDLYRVRDDSELEAAGFWELLEEPGGLTLIEWPERIPAAHFPHGRPVRTLEFHMDDDGARGVRL